MVVDFARAYPIPDTAIALNKSPTTVRRLIATGRLRARQVRGPGGTRWLITTAATGSYEEWRNLADTQRTPRAG